MTNAKLAWSKIPFLALCFVSLAVVAAGGVLLLYLVHPRLISLGAHYFYAVFAAVAAFVLVLFCGLSAITATVMTGVNFLFFNSSLTVRFLFPIAIFLAKLFRYDRAKLLASFVKVNNAMTVAQAKKITGPTRRILVLLPHCLQIDVCERKITNTLSNCKRCGKCPVGEFIEIGEKHDLKIEVVNGGTLARKRVAMFRPQGVIAVACERDLTLGIQDVHPVPVFGVINDRPHGPCVNTCVDMNLVGEAIKFFRG